MTVPNNQFQAVSRYMPSELAYLENYNVFIATANTKFKNFNKIDGNLGDTVTYDLPPRFTTGSSLVVSNQPSVQRVETLTVDTPKNVSTDYTAQQTIFNLEPNDYMDVFGKAAVHQLSATVEGDVAEQLTKNNGYRFYGDGVTPISSFAQLAKMLSLFRNFGHPGGEDSCYFSDTAEPDVIASGQNQFLPARNERLNMSWNIGDFNSCHFYRSSKLYTHLAGNVGNSIQSGSVVAGANILTVVSTNDPTGANITQITFSGATASDANAVYESDLFSFNDGVGAFPNLRFLQFVGQGLSKNKVQCRVTADAAADGSGNVVLNIVPALVSVQNQNQNILYNIVAGMQVTVLPSHTRGVIVGGNAFYLGMPELPDEAPYPTVRMTDPDTKVSLRIYWGSYLGQNQRIMVHDVIYGVGSADEYLMYVIFPLTQ